MCISYCCSLINDDGEAIKGDTLDEVRLNIVIHAIRPISSDYTLSYIIKMTNRCFYFLQI
ncbi:TPA: hypothetical protein I4G64_00310 [Enterobacter cloacae]|nr:hypothetical protein [Enterobacter pasteurii]